MNEIKIGMVLRQLMTQFNVTLRQIEYNTKIPYSTLHTWLHNGRPADILKIKRLADFFGVSISHLVFNECDESKNYHLANSDHSKTDSVSSFWELKLDIKKVE